MLHQVYGYDGERNGACGRRAAFDSRMIDHSILIMQSHWPNVANTAHSE